MLFTGPNQSAQHSGLGVEGVVVDAAGGAPFTTITQAIAYFAAHNPAGRRVIWVMPGTYAESFVVPAGPFSIIGLGQVEITGAAGVAVTLTDDVDEYLLENLQITSAAAGTCIDADMGGLAATGTVRLRNIRLVTSAAGVGLLASACNVFIEGGLRVACPGSSFGIDLTAGDAATERTRLVADRVIVQGAIVAAAIRTAGGAGGAADDVVRVEVTDLYLEGSNGSIGCIENSGGTVAEGLPSGFEIGTMHCVPAVAGGANTHFRSSNAAAENRIGRITGVVVSDILIDNDNGQTMVGLIDLPDDGVARDTFQVAVVTAGQVIIEGGEAAGGSSPVFQSLAGAGSLRVSNFTIPSLVAGGQFYTSADCTGVISFTDCDFTGTAAAVKIACDGGTGAGAFTLRRTRVDSTGAATVVTVLNGALRIDSCYLQQRTNTNHCVANVDPVAAGANIIRWEGDSTIDQATGGAGRGLFGVASSGASTTTLQEAGILRFVTCTPAEQFTYAIAATLLATAQIAHVVTSAFVPTTAGNPQFFGDAGTGQRSSYPGLRVCTSVGWTAGASAGGDDNFDVNVTNISSGAAAAVAVFPDLGAAAHREIAFTTPAQAILLVGPGQVLAAAGANVGVNASTNSNMTIQ